ncbi:MAG: TolC family protein [Myxococcota bacterium]
MSRLRLLALVTLLAPSAHAAPPDAEPPDADPPPSIREILETRESGLTAAEAAARAVEAAPEVRRAEAARDQAEHASERTRAGWIPQVDLEASYLRESDVRQPEFQVDGQTSGNPFPLILDNWLLSGTLRLPVTDWFLRVLPSYRSAEQQARASAWEADTQRQAIALQARVAFWDWVGARGAERIAEDSEALLQAHRDDAADRVDVGTAPRSDLLQAEAELAAARVRRLRAVATREVAEARLRRLLNRPAVEPMHPGATLFDASLESPVPPRGRLLATATRRRPEVLALQAIVEAREEQVDLERGARYPSLDLHARVDYANPNPRVFPQEAVFDTTWQAGVALTWRPTDLIGVEHAVEEAGLEVTRAREDLERLLRDLEVEIAEARSNLTTALEAVDAARAGVAAAQESHRARAARYAVGEGTSTEVLEAETTLRDNQLQLLQARIDARRARARLDHAVGRALP